jgi:exopolyphosphatase/guanosine-5'-triphosphate,3'-diphosphate pyrophosphatase
VVDIGGGSTEVIVAHDGQVVVERSLQLGSGRLTERCLASDPPTLDEVATARTMARTTLAAVPKAPADEAVIVGGTASALLRLTPRAAGDMRVTRARLDDLLAALMAAPAAAIATGGQVDVDRARVMPGGVLVVEAVMDHFELDAVSISQGGIREGVLLGAMAQANEGA